MAFYPNDMLTPTYLTGAVNDRPSKEAIRQQYKGFSYLPWEEVPERQVMYDVMYSENNLAGFYSPDGQAIPGDGVLFSSVIANLADVKASRNLKSWAVQYIRDPGMPAVYKAGGSSHVVQGMELRIKNHINEYLAWCNEAVDAQVEYIQMKALSDAQVAWPPVDNDGNTISEPMPHWNANMTVNVTFPLPANQNQAVTTLSGYGSRSGSGYAWTDTTNSTPLDDLSIINQYMIKQFGINLRGGTIIMSQIVLDYLARNASILKWVAGTNYEQTGARTYADEETLKSHIKSRFGWTIETYDAQWTYRTKSPHTKPTISRVDFLKEGKVVILPPGRIGGTMTTLLENEGAGWTYGKMGWSYRQPKPPYEVELGVNCTAWPKFEHYDWFVLDAYN